ncbi:MAG: hypothetical protein HRT82_10165 [Henriciella sp.]|jgi:hypothetical protein|nr:hypothetical protein [Henriciella sp.]
MNWQAINVAWDKANSRYGFDPIHFDDEAKQLLHEADDDDAQIEAAIDGMRVVRNENPSFFDRFDYEWAFDAAGWRRGLEANLQARMLQMLSQMWVSPNRPDTAFYDRVVSRYTFETGTDPCTPFHAPIDAVNFITVPFSFAEFLNLLVRGFIDSVAGQNEGWAALANFDKFDREAPVSGFLRQAILRYLTNDTFHPSFPGESPVDLVKRKSTWFGEAIETGNVDEETEIPLSNALLDFALAHELGHVLHGHEGVAAEPDLRLEKEQDADVMGFALYSTSWGWRDEVLDPCPMGQALRILMGPLVFHLFVKWHLALRQAAAFAKLKLKDHNVNVSVIKEDVGDSAARSDMTMKQLGFYEAQIRGRGAEFSETGEAIFRGLAKAGSAFTMEIFRSVQSIPDEDLELAIEAGRPLF